MLLVWFSLYSIIYFIFIFLDKAIKIGLGKKVTLWTTNHVFSEFDTVRDKTIRCEVRFSKINFVLEINVFYTYSLNLLESFKIRQTDNPKMFKTPNWATKFRTNCRAIPAKVIWILQKILVLMIIMIGWLHRLINLSLNQLTIHRMNQFLMSVQFLM